MQVWFLRLQIQLESQPSCLRLASDNCGFKPSKRPPFIMVLLQPISGHPLHARVAIQKYFPIGTIDWIHPGKPPIMGACPLVPKKFSTKYYFQPWGPTCLVNYTAPGTTVHRPWQVMGLQTMGSKACISPLIKPPAQTDIHTNCSWTHCYFTCGMVDNNWVMLWLCFSVHCSLNLRCS